MRKTETVTITAEGRDKGKQFLLTEMPALKAERWAFRALLALAHSGVEMPAGAAEGGMASFAQAGLQALNRLSFDEARPLLDEMWTCVQIIPEPKNPQIVRPLVVREMEGDDIEDIETIFHLRDRIFRLHTDFFFNAK
jgi:hypothetical protein